MIAEYVAASQFRVPGNQSLVFGEGQVVKLDMGTDGELRTIVVSVVYQAGDDYTYVVVESDALTINLATVLRGPTFVGATDGNISEHNHKSSIEGGDAPFGDFDDQNIVDRLIDLATIDASVGHYLFGVNSAGTDVEHITMVGTPGHVTVTKTAGQFAFSLPQPIRTTDSPTFGGLTLTGKNGIGFFSGGIVDTLSSDPEDLSPYKVALNDQGDYKLAGLSFFHLSNVAAADMWSNGHVPVWNSAEGKFNPGIGGGAVVQSVFNVGLALMFGMMFAPDEV